MKYKLSEIDLRFEGMLGLYRKVYKQPEHPLFAGDNIITYSDFLLEETYFGLIRNMAIEQMNFKHKYEANHGLLEKTFADIERIYKVILTEET